jgi:hypothetical protein
MLNGGVKMNDSTKYYFGVDSGELWCDLPYKEALELKIKLAREVFDKLVEVDYLARDGEKMNRVLRKIKLLEDDLRECKCLKS